MNSFLSSKKFKRNTEDFICENCGHENIGDGYTNHCKKCLWSKHVDINPGDRAENCGGLMEPISIYKKQKTFFIEHKCKKCGKSKNNSVQKNDNFDVIIKISSLES